MNKPILLPQLSATRARTGMHRVGDLIALLIKQYEMQDQLRAKRQQTAVRASRPSAPQPRAAQASQSPSLATSLPLTSEARTETLTAEFTNACTAQGKTKPVQATFGWFDSACPEPAAV